MQTAPREACVRLLNRSCRLHDAQRCALCPRPSRSPDAVVCAILGVECDAAVKAEDRELAVVLAENLGARDGAGMSDSSCINALVRRTPVSLPCAPGSPRRSASTWKSTISESKCRSNFIAICVRSKTRSCGGCVPVASMCWPSGVSLMRTHALGKCMSCMSSIRRLRGETWEAVSPRGRRDAAEPVHSPGEGELRATGRHSRPPWTATCTIFRLRCTNPSADASAAAARGSSREGAAHPSRAPPRTDTRRPWRASCAPSSHSPTRAASSPR